MASYEYWRALSGSHKTSTTEDTKNVQRGSLRLITHRTSVRCFRVGNENEKATRQLGGLFFKGE